MTEVARDADGRPFWDSCNARAMALQRCADCGRFRYPPRAVCPYCMGERAAWAPVCGTGSVYVALVVHPRRSREAPGEPFSLVIVELDEGVRMWSNVVGCDPDEVSIGQRVRVRYDETPEGTLPRFERVS